MPDPIIHKSVLLQQSIEGLDIKRGDVFVDATLGGAGHARAACELVGSAGTVVGLDADADAIARGEKRLADCGAKVVLKQKNFRELDAALSEAGLSHVDKILFDLGLSSQEIEESGRGFTFRKDEPLLMTFQKEPTAEQLTAREILNHWEAPNIETIIKSYGEERYARKIARAIVEHRGRKPFETTFDLVDVIEKAVPAVYRASKIHPATRTFQALRMTVNDEVGALKEGLTKGFATLNSGGRIAVISFHSIEDRIVKQFFKTMIAEGKAVGITKKPITATDEEIAENPRSRSAKLRIISKI